MALRLLLGYGGGARCLYGRGGEEEALHQEKAQQGRLPPAPRKGKVGSTSAVVSPYVRWGEAGGMSPIPREKRVFLRGLPVHRVHGGLREKVTPQQFVSFIVRRSFGYLYIKFQGKIPLGLSVDSVQAM